MKRMLRSFAVCLAVTGAVVLGACQRAGSDRPPVVLTPLEKHFVAQMRQGEGPDAASAATMTRLLKRLDGLKLDGTPFEAALRQLAREADVTILTNWGACEQLGITRRTVVSLELREVTAEAALRFVLTAAADREDLLGYRIRDGIVKVSTVEDLAAIRWIRVYDVRDILETLDGYEAEQDRRAERKRPRILSSATQPDGGGISIEGGRLRRPAGELVDALMRCLRTFVFPDSWAPTGYGTIWEFNGLLAVNQTPAGHRELGELLHQLRAGLSAAGHRQIRPQLDDPAAAARIRASESARAEVRARLSRPIERVALRNVPFEQALRQVAERAGVSLVPNWGAMEQLGITRGTRVSLQLKDARLETVLQELLARAAGREDLLGYIIRGNVITVSTRDDLTVLKYRVIYNVRDLLAAGERHRDRWLLRRFGGKLPEEVTVIGDEDDGDEYDGGLFGDDGDFQDSDYCPEDWGSIFRGDVGNLLFLLYVTVLPDSWAPTGDANVLELAGLLIVKQTEEGHRRLARLLCLLREALAASGGGGPRSLPPARAALARSLLGIELDSKPPRRPQPVLEPPRQMAEPDPKATADLFGLKAAAPAGRVVFVIDRSGSMAMTFAYVKAGLIRAIEKLTADQQFQVVFFDGGRPALLKARRQFRLVPATAYNKKVMREWIDNQIAQSIAGSTNPRPALEAAFKVAGGPPDVIFFVSDGLLPPETLDQLAALNARRQVRVFTVALKDSMAESEQLLRKMAEQNGGAYRFVSEEELGREY